MSETYTDRRISNAASADPAKVVIIGGGHAGIQAAASLRSRGHSRDITIVGEETDFPYQRPPLSKSREGASRESLNLRPQNFFDDLSIGLQLGRRVATIDRSARTVCSSDGTTFSYDHLILATGTRNRSLAISGVEFEGVHQLRSASDANAIRSTRSRAKDVVIIGAGFIGPEVAATAATAGKRVSVIEAATRPMSRQLTPIMSDFFRRSHEASGIRFHFQTVATRISGQDGSVRSVELSDGKNVPADFVLVGIGVVPNVELAEACGLRVDNGIVADEPLVASDPAISAIGDCAAFRMPHGGRTVGRLEPVQNAGDRGGTPYRSSIAIWIASLVLERSGKAEKAETADCRIATAR